MANSVTEQETAGTMTQAEYARHARVAQSTVSRWLRAGRIAAEANGRIDPARADRLRDATESPLPHHQARKRQLDEAKERPASPPVADSADDMSLEGLGKALKRETYRLQRAKAETAALELDRMAGALVERGEVEHLLRDIGHTLRRLVEDFPAKHTPTLAACGADADKLHDTLAAAARELLTEVIDHIARASAKSLP